jgi:hypothetical protein
MHSYSNSNIGFPQDADAQHGPKGHMGQQATCANRQHGLHNMWLHNAHTRVAGGEAQAVRRAARARRGRRGRGRRAADAAGVCVCVRTHICMCVCVCVCVCVRASQWYPEWSVCVRACVRERESQRSVLGPFKRQPLHGLSSCLGVHTTPPPPPLCPQARVVEVELGGMLDQMRGVLDLTKAEQVGRRCQ